MMRAVFDTDRYKIDQGPGKPLIGHYEMHCLFPVEMPGWILYVRGNRNWQIVARELAINKETILDIPGIPHPGITAQIDGSYCAFAFPQQFGKGAFFYDPQNFLMPIFDTAAKKFIMPAQPYTQDGITYPIVWLHPAAGLEYARSVRWNSATEVEYTTVENDADNLALQYKHYRCAVDIPKATISAPIVEVSPEVPTWL